MAKNLSIQVSHHRLSGRKRSSLKFLLGLFIAVAMFFPMYAVIICSVKTNGQVLSDPFGIPQPFDLTAFGLVLGKSGEFWGFLYNSVVIAVSTIIIVDLFSMAAGIALSRIPFKGRPLIYNFFIMGMLFPITVAVLPLYLQLRDLGLLGTQGGVILAEAAFGLPMAIFLFTGFFKDVPRELQDACQIDGGGILTFFFKIVIPISKPVVATVSIITFIQSWNQFLFPLLVLDNSSKFTIPLGIMQFQGQFTTGWNQVMAFITISIIPMAAFYFSAQRYIVAGLTAGAVKG
ncbi:carbohydrate ABC transporter permease [Sediminispirochaeta bajacaliforniensis]|uniref:carbohydrate ABC transporter permease n=1 Tax=Sediminispirochaeta bajacaliforniensis TaxID=148 RepID=UPI000367EEC1|nr:carbohydrate ABC transporter permease [Sediminispirochaeta bajacaliforniensis]